MSNFAALIATIQANIKTNGNEEITGAVLQDVLEAMVQALGTEAINNLETALGNEETARQNADGTLQDNIDAEALRAGTAEAGLDGRLDTIEGEIPSEASSSNKLTDKAYVDAADTALSNAIGAINDAIENGYVYAGIATPSGTPASGKVFYLAVTAGTYTNFGGLAVTQGINILKYNGTTWSQEQLIGIDDEPTAESNNLVKSGGVKTELNLINGEIHKLYDGSLGYSDRQTGYLLFNFDGTVGVGEKIHFRIEQTNSTFTLQYIFEDGTKSSVIYQNIDSTTYPVFERTLNNGQAKPIAGISLFMVSMDSQAQVSLYADKDGSLYRRNLQNEADIDALEADMANASNILYYLDSDLYRNVFKEVYFYGENVGNYSQLHIRRIQRAYDNKNIITIGYIDGGVAKALIGYENSVDDFNVINGYNSDAGIGFKAVVDWTLLSAGSMATYTESTPKHPFNRNCYKLYNSCIIRDSLADAKDRIKSQCGIFESYGELIDVSSRIEGVTGCIIAPQTAKLKFADKGVQLCGIKQSGDVSSVAKIDIDNITASSWTIVFYMPPSSLWANPSGEVAGEQAGYMEVCFNNNEDYKASLFNAMHLGWNYATLTSYEITGLASLSVSSIYLRLYPHSSIEVGDEFFNIQIDSVITNLKSKPTILLNFDQVWNDSISNGGYDYMYENGIPCTIFCNDYENMAAAKIAELKKMQEHGWEIGYYGAKTQGLNIDALNTYSSAKQETELMRADLFDALNEDLFSYASSQAKGSVREENVLKIGGIKMYRSLFGQNFSLHPPLPTFPSIPLFCKGDMWMAHDDASLTPLAQIESFIIDKAISLGLIMPIFTHGICNIGDTTCDGSSSSAMPLDKFKDMVDYLVQKRDSGQLQILTFREFYNMCIL